MSSHLGTPELQLGRTSPSLTLSTYGNTSSNRRVHMLIRNIEERLRKLRERAFRIPSARRPSERPATVNLNVEDFDLKVPENTKQHHTDEYEITQETDAANSVQQPQLVVRRGQTFDVDIKFNQPFAQIKSILGLQFQIGGLPQVAKGTMVKISLSEKSEKKDWEAVVKSSNGNTVTVTVSTPSNCLVGKWEFEVISKAASSDQWQSLSDQCVVYILFNAWCKDDQVFMEKEEERNEYVLNDTGCIFVGTSDSVTPKPWNFGQFESVILDCAMYLLENSKLKPPIYGDAIRVCRVISALVNSQDDDGILIGNWSGNYRNGTSPLKWNGSVSILEQYFNAKKSVAFGQCWVFSGVLTSVCRALGIPTRSITNFSSAHDTDGSITVDMYFDENGDMMDDMNSDSIWNFHVWNEAWMTRPDLPGDYGGWQIVDATPQETSDGVYCCGPASQKALKRGEMEMRYDCPFAFAEVNADIIFWFMDETGEFKKIGQRGSAVGKNISTKMPGPDTLSRLDVTKEYKFEEGSVEERASILRAFMSGSSIKEKEVYDQGDPAVTFELTHNAAALGKDFVMVIKEENKTDVPQTVQCSMNATSVYYTGVNHDTIKKSHSEIKLGAHEKKESQFTLSFDEYYEKLTDHCGIYIHFLLKIHDTHQVYSEEIKYSFTKPTLTIKAPDSATVKEAFTVEVSLRNELPISLTKCQLSVEGPGIQKPLVLPQKDISSNGTFHTTVMMTPVRSGTRKVLMALNAVELEGVTGECSIIIKED